MAWSGPKKMFAVRTWQLARRGWGSEDIFVALRRFGVTLEYAKSVVLRVETERVYHRERKRTERKTA